VAEKGIDEDTAFREILVRLTEKYPDVVPERVAAIVDGVRAEMSTAKVRDFVPVRGASGGRARALSIEVRCDDDLDAGGAEILQDRGRDPRVGHEGVAAHSGPVAEAHMAKSTAEIQRSARRSPVR
jgi:hypothetical protein